MVIYLTGHLYFFVIHTFKLLGEWVHFIPKNASNSWDTHRYNMNELNVNEFFTLGL